jgi:thiosulfate/3-mercaptopyruvate sulfurtransferase
MTAAGVLPAAVFVRQAGPGEAAIGYIGNVKTPGFALAVLAAVALAAEISVVQPKDLAEELAAKAAAPAVFQVGPNVLYRSKHIPGSVFAGPGSKAEGLELLKTAVKGLKKDREIVIYCGCCPWDHCPNIKPAFEALRQMGFTRVKALYVPLSFKTDWIDRAYPVE